MGMQLPNDYSAVCLDQAFRTFCLSYKDVCCLQFVSEGAVNVCPGKHETNGVRDLLLLITERFAFTLCNYSSTKSHCSVVHVVQIHIYFAAH